MVKKKTGINRFRILALAFSLILFAAGIVVTLGIFLPITGLVSPNTLLFRMGQQVFSVYRFSAFLIPILFLYGAVLLLIPGWTRESKAVLLGVPLYFVTAIIAERLITIFSPAIALSIVRHFVIISIVICALLLVCFEIFLMLMLAEKLTGHRFVIRRSVDETIDSDNEEDDEWVDAENDEAESVLQEAVDPAPIKTEDSVAETTATAETGSAAAMKASDLAGDTESQTAAQVVVPDNPAAPVLAATQSQTFDTKPAASTDSAAGTASVEGEPELLKPVDDAAPLPLSTPLAAVITEELPECTEPAQTIREESLSEVGTAASDFTDEAAAADTAVHPMNEAVVGGSADLPDETVAQDVSHDGDTTMITAGDRVADATVSETESVTQDEYVSETETEPAPVFDPADPDNLFSSLEEITD